MPVGVLEPETAIAKVDLASNARVDHPLQRAIDGGPTDLLVFLPHQVDEVVGAEMAVLIQEDADDAVSLAGPLPALWAQAVEIICAWVHTGRVHAAVTAVSLDVERRPASAG